MEKAAPLRHAHLKTLLATASGGHPGATWLEHICCCWRGWSRIRDCRSHSGQRHLGSVDPQSTGGAMGGDGTTPRVWGHFCSYHHSEQLGALVMRAQLLWPDRTTLGGRHVYSHCPSESLGPRPGCLPPLTLWGLTRLRKHPIIRNFFTYF